MRNVMVFEYKRENGRLIKVEKGEAIFHQFGVDFEEFESGAGNYSTAIVEWPDGNVENIRVDSIRFLNEAKS